MGKKKTRKRYAIVTYPSDILREKAKDVRDVTKEIMDMIDSMVMAMDRNQGIGLAAPQVGIDLRLAVVRCGRDILKLINPIIIDKKGKNIMEEGCLSVPGVSVRICRAKALKVAYRDLQGKKVIKDYDGLPAKVIQHEIDHLNGKLIIDYMPWYKKVLNIHAKSAIGRSGGGKHADKEI